MDEIAGVDEQNETVQPRDIIFKSKTISNTENKQQRTVMNQIDESSQQLDSSI